MILSSLLPEFESNQLNFLMTYESKSGVEMLMLTFYNLHLQKGYTFTELKASFTCMHGSMIQYSFGRLSSVVVVVTIWSWHLQESNLGCLHGWNLP